MLKINENNCKQGYFNGGTHLNRETSTLNSNGKNQQLGFCILFTDRSEKNYYLLWYSVRKRLSIMKTHRKIPSTDNQWQGKGGKERNTSSTHNGMEMEMPLAVYLPLAPLQRSSCTLHIPKLFF